MSLDLHYKDYQHFANNSLAVKSDCQVQAERETFNKGQSNASYVDSINFIYEIIRGIKDPEHPYTLEQLDVVNIGDIDVQDKGSKIYITVYWKPSVPSVGVATHLGLAIRLKLERDLRDYPNIRINLFIKEGGHKHRKIIDKQLNDKERLIAAQENETLMNSIEMLIS